MNLTHEKLAELKTLAEECQLSVSDMTDAQYCRVFSELREACPALLAYLEEALDRHVRRLEIGMDVFERVCRAICSACEENPDHKGDARGNDFRWQDYADAADAAISAMYSGESCKWECTYDGAIQTGLHRKRSEGNGRRVLPFLRITGN